MAPTNAPPPRWNAALGVWDGDRAAGADFVPPDPLYIFGYGSLCYKRDELPSDEEFVGRVRGWRRLFAQSSTDHRGTPDKPGLVATLLSDAQLDELGLRAADEPPSACCGMCCRVPKDRVADVLDALDFREKGGYSRDVVDVERASADGGAGSVRALVYSATPDNPNFVRPTSIDAAAATVAAAVGPSGPNPEYVFALERWLREVGEEDAHVFELAEAVRRIVDAEG